MKLYVVNMKISDVIKDVITIVESDDKSVHRRVDSFMADCKNCGLEEYAYDGYSFTEVNNIDGYNINVAD